MKVLKFGGKSLANGTPLEKVLNIIKRNSEASRVAVVVSARGESTNALINLYEKALAGISYTSDLEAFFEYQRGALTSAFLSVFQSELAQLLKAIQLLNVRDQKTLDRVMAFGELISAKTIAELLKKEGYSGVFVDARKLFKLENEYSGADIDLILSGRNTREYFDRLRSNEIPIITGFIASDQEGNTVTLGRNGSNYTATLIASFIGAEEVQNWTNVDGVFSASPKYVKNARKIPHLSYREANELANFGMNVLHAKTILPLIESSIPLKIFNSFSENGTGTLIDKEGAGKGIKVVSVIEDVSLVSIEGRGLLGKIGIDARIFTALSQNKISVRLISQASSERGVGFVVDKEDARLTEIILKNEFSKELINQDISKIEVNNDRAIIAIVGRHNYALEKAIHGLRRNKIWMHLISNSISGEHISLVIDKKHLKKAVNVVHNQVFGAIKTLNLFAFGKGNVGGELLDQIIATKEEIVKERGLKINVIGVADSQRFVFDEDGLGKTWRGRLEDSSKQNDFETILNTLSQSGIENIVIADNTSSQEVTNLYPEIIRRGFDIAASNKKANSIDFSFYEELRNLLKRKGRLFYYETNVGAGLPLIDTIKNLKNSSDKIKKIVGVFSGSLSYIFNHYSIQDKAFSGVLTEAKKLGLTEPDPREDLSGMDVARKLIILAREVGLNVEFEDVKVEDLIPYQLKNEGTYDDFIGKKEVLDKHFETIKNTLKPSEVLRYVGELDVANNSLKVALVKADQSSPLGNIKNSDSIFEIYTEGYGEQPIIIQGAGAGAEVTARGVYSDLLRIGTQY